MYRHRFLPALATVVPAAATHAANLYAGATLKLFFVMENGTITTIHSARVVQRGCNIEGLCYSTGVLSPQEGFRADPRPAGAKISEFIEVITVSLRPEKYRDIDAVTAFYDLGSETTSTRRGTTLKRRETFRLLGKGASISPSLFTANATEELGLNI